MTTPTDDQLAAAAQKARADHETAREIAARLLAPPDPVDILAGVIADRGEVADERDELRAKCDALIRERDLARADRDAARVARKDATEEVERLSALLATAEKDAEAQYRRRLDLRAASRPAALPADLRTYLETRHDRLQGGHGLAVAAEIAALRRWIELPAANTTGGGK